MHKSVVIITVAGEELGIHYARGYEPFSIGQVRIDIPRADNMQYREQRQSQECGIRHPDFLQVINEGIISSSVPACCSVWSCGYMGLISETIPYKKDGDNV